MSAKILLGCVVAVGILGGLLNLVDRLSLLDRTIAVVVWIGGLDWELRDILILLGPVVGAVVAWLLTRPRPPGSGSTE